MGRPSGVAGCSRLIRSGIYRGGLGKGGFRLHAGQIEAYDGGSRPSLPEFFLTDGQGCPSYEMPHFSPREVQYRAFTQKEPLVPLARR